MNKIWMETLSPDDHVLMRQRFDQPVIQIGHGYHNDVLFDDPHFHENDIFITRLENGDWLAEATGQGMQIEAQNGLVKSYVLHGDVVIRIGDVKLRFRTAGYISAIKATPKKHPLNVAVMIQKRGWVIAGVLFVVLLASVLLQTWLNETTQTEMSYYLKPLASISFGMLIWAGLWSLLSRLFASQAKFIRHLIGALIAVMLIDWISTLIGFADFSFGMSILSDIWQYLIGPVVALWVYLHLRIMGKSHKQLKIAILSLLTFVVIGGQILMQHEKAPRKVQFDRMTSLLPPFMRLAPPRKMSDFFDEAEKMKTELDVERTKELTGESGDF